MAIIKFNTTGALAPLMCHHVIGRRHPALSEPTISSEHLTIRWSRGDWHIRDMSKNGTWLNGEKLSNRHDAILRVNDRLSLASPTENQLTLCDGSPPQACLVPYVENAGSLGKLKRVILLEDAPILPLQLAPGVFIHQRGVDEWWVERAEHYQRLEHGQILCVGRATWTFWHMKNWELTQQYDRKTLASNDAITLRFNCSLNEEHVVVKLIYESRVMDLGERTHHFLTLTLARKWQTDAEAGIVSSERGWIAMEELSDMLALEVAHINIQIFRARKQICDALNNGFMPDKIIERRRGTVRLGEMAFSITPRKTALCSVV